MKKLFIGILFLSLFISRESLAGTIDLEKLCEAIVDLYKTEEVPAKKERLVYKKLADLISETAVSMKITTTDSIRYDKKEDKTILKSKEIYYADNKTGYFGIYVYYTKMGDELLMSTSPGKEMSISGKITDIIVVEALKNNLMQKSYTPLKEFDDSGTILQKIIIRVDG